MSQDWLQKSMMVNVMPHVHLAQAIAPNIKQHPIKWLSLSAMVGSLSDNNLGGWYSYRMSKAALNMFIRNLSIEWQRKSPKNIVVAVHPGTTESELSAPFQKNIAKDKLYSQELTAQRISNFVESLSADQNGTLLHWDGSNIAF